jgi:hypothetical protein
MNTIQKLNAIRNRILDTAAMCNEYKDHWSHEYALKTLSEGFSTRKAFMLEEIPMVTKEELADLSRDTLYLYGFGNWDGELLLIPLWLVNFMPPDTIVTSIMGTTSTLSGCDKDTRGGCIAFGFFL